MLIDIKVDSRRSNISPHITTKVKANSIMNIFYTSSVVLYSAFRNRMSTAKILVVGVIFVPEVPINIRPVVNRFRVTCNQRNVFLTVHHENTCHT
jgi:hypothetical protein